MEIYFLVFAEVSALAGNISPPTQNDSHLLKPWVC